MFNAPFRILVKVLLWLRYRIDVQGLEKIQSNGLRGILFLPSHPALIDPFIVISVLNKLFAPKIIADSEAISIPGIRTIALSFGAYPIPDMAKQGPEARRQIEGAMARCAEGLKQGENWLLYPAGHILKSQVEEIGANSAVEMVLRHAPDTRIVLVRTRGLWGSAFSRAHDGRPPMVGKAFVRGLFSILLNGIFFTPRRQVTLEFAEPTDLPRTADRLTINRYLEQFYNAEPLPRNTYVPYTVWERSGETVLAEPVQQQIVGDVDSVSDTTRQLVMAHLREITDREDIRDTDRLAADLGMDSLVRAELMVWLEQEFGFPQGYADSLQTVTEVLLAASGEAMSNWIREPNPVPSYWFTELNSHLRISIPNGHTVAEAFLAKASRMPDTVIVADQSSGVRSYRGLVTSILALLPSIKRLSGDHVGIMLPASVTADIVYLAVIFAGKVPVMINWTMGPRNLLHSLNTADVKHVLTSQRLLTRLETQGTDLSEIQDRFTCLETLAVQITPTRKFGAWLQGHITWTTLRHAKIQSLAAILFTSGSESLPKAVPLTHANLLTNLRDVLSVIELRESDRLLGMLPPFHSFGLTVNMLLPLCGGLRTVYHPNPTEGATLARIIELYHATLLVGTPTFLYGIVRVATPTQLVSLRLAVAGAEECPSRVYAALTERCPQATLLEGYGITECSPIVAVNSIEHPHPFTIGQLLPSLEYALLDVDTGKPIATDETAGMLLLRGPSVFSGYLGADAPNPFVEYDNRFWYRTGDLVSIGADDIFTFRGRLKRFIKIGGEMISLPAIESALLEQFDVENIEGPSLAILATENTERPELVLVTIFPIDRETVNRQIRGAGLSPLHNIRQVVVTDTIPVLGTGKTDYQSLQQQLGRQFMQASNS